jgi:hypothetical protein
MPLLREFGLLLSICRHNMMCKMQNGRVVVFSMFLNVGSVLVIAKTLTYVAVRVPFLGLIKGLWLLKPYQTG